MEEEKNYSAYQVFVGGLPSNTTENDLLQYFKQFGAINSCKPQMWKSSKKKCRGFALLNCNNRLTYQKIIRSKHTFKNRLIECKKAFSSKKELREYEEDLIGRKVFVGGLPLNLRSEQLQKFFQKFAEVEIAYVVTKHKCKKSKGFGYVCFRTVEECHRILKIKKFDLNGKKITCSPYEHKCKNKNLKTLKLQKLNAHNKIEAPKDSNEEKIKKAAKKSPKHVLLKYYPAKVLDHVESSQESKQSMNSNTGTLRINETKQRVHESLVYDIAQCKSLLLIKNATYNPNLGVYFKNSYSRRNLSNSMQFSCGDQTTMSTHKNESQVYKFNLAGCFRGSYDHKA